MYASKLFSTTALLAALGCPAPAFAQAMTVFGGGSLARDCFTAARMAATLPLSVDRGTDDPCDLALENGGLSIRDLTATYVNRGVIRAAREDYDGAIADYETALKLKPEFAETYINRGNIFFMGRAYGRAVEDYSRAMEFMESDKLHIALLNRGLAYEKLGERANAEADYRRALQIAPDWSLAQEKLDKLLQSPLHNAGT